MKLPGLILLVAMTLDVKLTLESSESMVTELGASTLSFAGFKRKSFVWRSMLLSMFCKAKFVAVFEYENGLICCSPSVEPKYVKR